MKTKLGNNVYFITKTRCVPSRLALVLSVSESSWLRHSRTCGVVSACVSRWKETNFNIFCNPIISTSTYIHTRQFSYSWRIVAWFLITNPRPPPNDSLCITGSGLEMLQPREWGGPRRNRGIMFAPHSATQVLLTEAGRWSHNALDSYSNLGQAIVYPDRGVLWFSSVPPCKCQCGASIRQRPLLSNTVHFNDELSSYHSTRHGVATESVSQGKSLRIIVFWNATSRRLVDC
jgi:hypothetical protein